MSCRTISKPSRTEVPHICQSLERLRYSSGSLLKRETSQMIYCQIVTVQIQLFHVVRPSTYNNKWEVSIWMLPWPMNSQMFCGKANVPPYWHDADSLKVLAVLNLSIAALFWNKASFRISKVDVWLSMALMSFIIPNKFSNIPNNWITQFSIEKSLLFRY